MKPTLCLYEIYVQLMTDFLVIFKLSFNVKSFAIFFCIFKQCFVLNEMYLSFLAFVVGMYNPLGVLVMAGIDVLPLALLARNCNGCLPLLFDITSYFLPILIIGRLLGFLAEVSFRNDFCDQGERHS